MGMRVRVKANLSSALATRSWPLCRSWEVFQDALGSVVWFGTGLGDGVLCPRHGPVSEPRDGVPCVSWGPASEPGSGLS